MFHGMKTLPICGREIAERHEFAYTIVRPVFIYGPYNYALREKWYIKNLVERNPIPHPTDATGRFQMVYVKDVARAILLCLIKAEADGQSYILSAPQVLTYDLFLQSLSKAAGHQIKTVPVTIRQVLSTGIPLPFPLTAAENELFDGHKIVRELGVSYENPQEAMKKTYQAFYTDFQRQGDASLSPSD